MLNYTLVAKYSTQNAKNRCLEHPFNCLLSYVFPTMVFYLLYV